MFNKDTYLNSLTKEQELKLKNIYNKYPVKDLSTERKKLIENGRINYPNGFEILDDGLVNLYLI